MITHSIVSTPLAACILETFLYAAYFVLFFCALRVQRRREAPPVDDTWARRTVRAIFSITLLLFACITTHWILEVYRIIHAFGYAATLEDAIRYASDLGHPTYVAQNGVYAATRIMMDGLLVLRLYVVWEHQYSVILLPAFGVVGDLVSTIMLSYWGLRYDGPTSPNYLAQEKWIISAYSFSCCTNVMASALISFRIIQRNRILASFALRTSLMPVILIVVESAVAYTSFHLSVFILLLTKNYRVLGILFPSIGPLIGIVYSLIMMQTTLGLTRLRRNDTTLPTLHQISFAPNPDAPPRDAITTGSIDVELSGDTGDEALKLSEVRPSYSGEEQDTLAAPSSRKSAHSRSHSSMV